MEPVSYTHLDVYKRQGEMVFFIPWRVVADDSGAATSRPARAAWVVQRLLAARW